MAIRRLAAFVVLALFMGVPVLQLRCVIACAADDVSGSADACPHHHDVAAGHAILESPHDCGEHATPMAVLSADRLLGLDALPVASMAPATSALDAKFAAPSFVIAPPGGPPGTFLVPLRV